MEILIKKECFSACNARTDTTDYFHKQYKQWYLSKMEEKVISLYMRGISAQDIHHQLNNLYGIELSAEMASQNM